MDIDTGKKRRFPALAISAVIFLLCIPGQFWATKWFPNLSGLALINPSLVFLHIPTPLPFTIDLILLPGLFLLIYPVVVLLCTSRPRQAIQRARNAFVGFFALLFCMLSGGYVYYLLQDQLSPRIRNGIDSLGINADLHLSYPGLETIHLRGSMVLLVCFIIGLIICIRKIRKEPAMLAARLTREQRMTPYDRMIQEKRMMLKSGMKIKEQQADKGWQPVYPAAMTNRPDWNVHQRLCYNQPVITFTPVAVAYMPM